MDESPAWSADGSRLAFIRRSGNDYRLYVVSRDGSGLREIAHTPSTGLFQFLATPAWSPDGRTIAFARHEFGQTSMLFVVDARGGNERLLAPGAESPTWDPHGSRIAFVRTNEIRVLDLRHGTEKALVLPARAFVGRVAWSPDGKRLAYEDRGEIYTVNVDGSGRRRLTRDGVWEGEPAWAPDGRIVFARGGRWGFRDVRPTRIYVMDADGTRQRPLIER